MFNRYKAPLTRRRKSAKVSEEEPEEVSADSRNHRKVYEKKRKHELCGGDTMIKEKMEIFLMVRSRNWNRVRKALRSGRGKILCSYKDDTNLNILGMTLGLRPPTEIVELILSINPNLVHEPDDHGALPLHLGCLNGISMEVFQLVTAGSGSKAARAQDIDNRTALHHAVEYICLLSKCDDSNNSSLISIMYEESIEVIENLLSMVPEAVHCVTVTGDCPLDIPHIFKVKWGCIENPRLDEVYRLLKATSIELYHISKKRWEREGYDTKVEPHQTSIASLEYSEVSSQETTSRIDLYRDLTEMTISSDLSRTNR